MSEDQPLQPEPLDWREPGEGVWTGRNRSISFRIIRRPSGIPWRRRLTGRTVRLVLEGDHVPEWWCRTADEAKRKAEEINKSAPFYGDEGRPNYWPIVVSDGDQVRALTDQPEPPTSVLVCNSCGSSKRPVAFKPLRCTIEWWDDPSAYWRCPACGGSRAETSAP
jgi:hypothetical protein